VGAADQVYADPAHPYTAGLLDAIPVPNPDLRRSKQARVAVRGELPSPVHPPSGCRFRTRCPRAQDICAAEEPALQDFGGNHKAACHFPLRTPVSLISTH
jgi:oligopeptide/dipeptide ABC transporter ATP-binding protein